MLFRILDGNKNIIVLPLLPLLQVVKLFELLNYMTQPSFPWIELNGPT